jgi:type III restriction enzyme
MKLLLLIGKDKETTNFRELLQNTRAENTKIILVIDESHTNADSERALELRDKIVAPFMTIEMSATPALNESEFQEKVYVDANDVIKEGMIKKEIIINENIDKIDDDDISSQELVLFSAYLKRLELKRDFEEGNIEVNPLVLIQLPTSDAGADKKEFIETFLAEKNITTDNGKLAVWLSEEKIHTEILENNSSEVEFLIFKQAIDTGWDCPRAQILVRFREIRSITFEIQTIGRILRMPEARHYQNDNLNKGYVFTNLKSIDVKKETYNPNIIKSVYCRRKDIYKPIKLRSYYRNRIDYGDITASFYKILESTFCKYFEIEQVNFQLGIFEINKKKLVEKNVELINLEITDEIILNKILDTKYFEHLSEEKISSVKNFQAHLSQDDLFHTFEYLIKINLNGFAPKRSLSIVKQAIYRWFKKYLNINLLDNGIIYIQNICLNNVDIFSILIDKAINEYKPIKEKEKLEKIEETEVWNPEWEISENRNFNPHTYKKYDYKLNLYNPCYLNIDSNVEKEFIEHLEANKEKLEWWWQNGNEHMALNFGIKYGNDSTFQPDFIVKYSDGKIGIFDTKAVGDRDAENALKAEALQKYISEENKKGRNLIGGLVIKSGEHFRINYELNYQPFKVNEKAWDYFG